MAATVSVVIVTKNEEKNLVQCLESVSWCDEKIIIDDASTDNTVAIAEKLGAKVFRRALNNDFSAQRNFGLEKARSDWVLFLDADERVSLPLQYEITNHVSDSLNKTNGYYIKRIDSIWGTQLRHGETANIKFLRLAKKGTGKWEGTVHEEWKVNGRKQTLNKPLLHYPHQTVGEFLREINFYTDLRAQELFHYHKRSYWFSILLFPAGKFFVNYFLKAGFLDATAGLVHATLMSFHSFLVRGKLWLLYKKQKKNTDLLQK